MALAVNVCNSTSPGCSRNGPAVAASFREELERVGLDDEVEVRSSSCLGGCRFGPTAEVLPDDVRYCRLTPERVRAVVDDHIVGGRVVRSLLIPVVDRQRWAEVLLSAAGSFAANGFAGTTMATIAEGAGMKRGTLYRLVNCKDDLLAAVVEEPIRRMVVGLREVVRAGGTGRERIEAFLASHAQHLADEHPLIDVYLQRTYRFPHGPNDALRATALEYETLVEELVVQGQADGSLRAEVPPRLAAAAILGALNWAPSPPTPDWLAALNATTLEGLRAH
jgi:AcrR family transcriptional regulator/(2Fe-2S) ferredoxin